MPPFANFLAFRLAKDLTEVDDLTDFVAPDKEHFPNLYESIEDYTTQTGKRFRMTKEQKSRELTREQAFKEMYLGDN